MRAATSLVIATSACTRSTPSRSPAVVNAEAFALRVWGAELAADDRSFLLIVGRRSSQTQEWAPADVYTVAATTSSSR
jgi:hypothetical protein